MAQQAGQVVTVGTRVFLLFPSVKLLLIEVFLKYSFDLQKNIEDKK